MPQPGFFVLHPAVLPPLKAGTYTLHGVVEQLPGDAVIAPLDTYVTVSSPRFTMPPEQILSTYPPANREGSFQETLPQIVLKRRTLPWERGVDPADEHLPWLALVVLAEGEASLSGEARVEECVTPGVALPHPDDRDTATSLYLTVTDTVVKGVFPTRDDVRLLAHVREVDIHDSELLGGDDDGFVAVVIANRLPQPAFDGHGNPAPKKYLACLVNLEGQFDVLPPPPPDIRLLTHQFEATAVVQDLRSAAAYGASDPDRSVMGGAVSTQAVAAGPVIVAGPAADPTGTATRAGAAWAAGAIGIDAAAVSVGAHDAAGLVRDAMAGGWRIGLEYMVLEPTYRFPVLAHWSFTVSGDPTFEQLMKGLDVGLIGTLVGDLPPKTPQQVDVERHRAPPPVPARGVPEVAETGHIGLAHQTRRGDHVTAWFRGPLSPHPTTREKPLDGRLPLAHTSDQLRTAVPDGREDVSLAAAFEIGRLLALSQPAVVNALLRWRQEQFGAERAAHLAAHANGPNTFFGALFDGRDPGLGGLLGRHLVFAASDRPEKVLAPTRRLVDPGRPLDYARGDLDELMARGLGLNLDQIQAAAQQVGIVGALAGTAVSVAEARDPRLDGPGFAALGADLDHAATSLAADVLAGQRGSWAAPSMNALIEMGRQGHPATDALDGLLGTFEEGSR